MVGINGDSTVGDKPGEEEQVGAGSKEKGGDIGGINANETTEGKAFNMEGGGGLIRKFLRLGAMDTVATENEKEQDPLVSEGAGDHDPTKPGGGVKGEGMVVMQEV